MPCRRHENSRSPMRNGAFKGDDVAPRCSGERQPIDNAGEPAASHLGGVEGGFPELI